ncbi:hypothetical protein T10_6673, partial [Trichinella papuae]
CTVSCSLVHVNWQTSVDSMSLLLYCTTLYLHFSNLSVFFVKGDFHERKFKTSKRSSKLFLQKQNFTSHIWCVCVCVYVLIDNGETFLRQRQQQS